MMKLRPALTLTLLFVLALSACGTASTPKPLKVIFSAPLDTDWGTAMQNAAQLAFSRIDGKIGNTPIEFIIHDGGIEENKELDGVELARNDEQVIAYVGAFFSGHAREIIPVANGLRLPIISPSATWPGLTKTGYAIGEPGKYYPNGERMFFRVVPSDDIQGRVAAQWLNERGYKTVFVVSEGNPYSEGLANILLSNLEDFGMFAVGNELIDGRNVTPESLSALTTAIEASNADVVFFPNILTIGEGSAILDVLVAIHDSNPARPILGSDGITGTTISADFARLTNIYATTFEIDLEANERIKTFITDYQAKYGVALSSSDYDAIGAYEALMTLFAAIARAGDTPTRASVLQALRQTQNYEGVYGTWSFDENGDTTFAGFVVLTLENGDWVSK